MSVFSGSRYTPTPVYRPNNNSARIMVLREKATFNLDTATYYTVIEGDTIDGIAYRKYGDAQLYWAIMDANPTYMSEMEIKPGDVLVIPSYSEVVSYLG